MGNDEVPAGGMQHAHRKSRLDVRVDFDDDLVRSGDTIQGPPHHTGK
jgi:hypothetical protein